MQRGLREVRRRDGCLSNDNLDLALANRGLRFDPGFAAPNQHQQTPLGPSMLHRYSYQLLDELGEDHLT